MSIAVLLVDEDEDVLDIVRTFLEQEDDLAVTGETDPEAALSLAVNNGGFDVVVSDFKMPRLTGIELCKELRAEGEGLPFLLFSGREPDEMQPEAREAGVTGIVQKGTGTEQYRDLAERIRTAL